MSWIRRWSTSDSVRAWLLCFPPGAGGAHLYRSWVSRLPSDIGVAAVEPPGRGSRAGEPLVVDLDEVVSAVTGAVVSLLDRPVVLLGHSMGAMLAHHVGCRLRDERRWRPAGLVAAACESPDLYHVPVAAAEASDGDMLAQVRRWGGTAGTLLADGAFVEAMLPVLRADLALAASGPRGGPASPRLDCPVFAYLGTDDPEVTPEQATGWTLASDGRFEIRRFDGGHLFLHQAADTVLPQLVADLESCLSIVDSARPVGSVDVAASALRGLSAQRQALVVKELARRRAARVGSIPRAARDGGRLPLSFAQERLWFLDQASPGSLSYVVPVGLRLRGALDLGALGATLDELARRHEVLRTTFPAPDGRPYQRVAEPDPVPLPVLERPAGETDAWVDEQFQAEVGRPFALDSEPPIRARVLRLRADDHVLLLTFHHIATDGWSLGVLVREFCALYHAGTERRPSGLAELPLQYGDYAAWQHDRLAVGALDAQIGYWRGALAGAPVLELPTDRPRPAVRSGGGSSVLVGLPVDLVRRVDGLAERAGATPYMVLLAAFTAVLARWSGQRDVVVGCPVAGRGGPELDDLIGFFVNTLPLRIRVEEGTFLDIVAAARDACVQGFAHQDAPFERLVQVLAPDRTAGPIPLVQVMLALRNTPMPLLALPGLDCELLDFTSLSSKFDLSLDLVPTGDGRLDGRVEFSTELFEPATARRIADAFVRLLAAATDDPERSWDRLPLIDAATRADLLGPLAGTGSAAAADTAGRLDVLIAERAAEGPDRPAVACGDRALTYRDLDERATALARRLRDWGAGPEVLVGICLPRGEDMVVALLAVLKAGAGYIPLDPGYPRDRVDYMLADCGAPIVLTTSAIAAGGLLDGDDSDGAAAPRLVHLDRPGAFEVDGDAGEPESSTWDRRLAYVIYTSGSTGRPKGSGNDHGGVANTLRGLNEVLGLTAEDRVLAISSLNYDMSVYEIFGTLLAGACVVVPGEVEITDPARLRELVIGQRVSAWSSAPALLEVLVGYAQDHGGLDGCALRLIMLGGDRMSPTLAQRLAVLVPAARLYNLAGMTEVSYASTYHPVSAEDAARGVIPWGRPLPNQRLYVLDPYGEPVPIGVPGELYVGGAGVRRGYWRRPALTAERFVPDPFDHTPGARLYRTGDGARWRSDGGLEFIGRLDNQVKVRGFRIELGEIEAALSAHPAVTDQVVILRSDGDQPRLIAYLTARADAPSVNDLRRHLLDRLPDHMVPSTFVVLDRLPLMPSGKLDRTALPVPQGTRPDLDKRYTAPDGPLEVLLADVFAELLGLDAVGVEDNFFDLGGHSLLVTQATSRLRDMLRVEVPIRDFLNAGSVREIAGRIRELGTAEGTDVDRVADLTVRIRTLPVDEVDRQLRALDGAAGQV